MDILTSPKEVPEDGYFTFVGLPESVERVYGSSLMVRVRDIGCVSASLVSISHLVLVIVHELPQPLFPVQDLVVVTLQPLFTSVYPAGMAGVQPLQGTGVQQLLQAEQEQVPVVTQPEQV
jgi:hypothetical protein